MAIQSYIFISVIYFTVLTAVSFYVHKSRAHIDEMHGMMIGMIFGMLAGMTAAALFLIPTGNFLNGLILGCIIGLLFGIPFGTLGGHLGMLEGTVAGPMGGMMGAMLGQMIRPFNIEVFMPFFTFIFLITLIGITYAVNCRVKCSSSLHQSKNVPSKDFILIWAAVSVFLLAVSFFLTFSITAVDSSSKITGAGISKNYQIPESLKDLMKETRKEAVIKGSYQEIDLQITSSRYDPNVLVAKKNLPLIINLYSDKDAGCAREIVFPDFNIDKIVPAGGKERIEILPETVGEFIFRCSMDMIRGKLLVVE